jgi:1-phosphofructokinase family hexose kinase
MQPVSTVSLNSCIDRSLAVNGLELGAHCQAELLAEIPAGKGMNVARLLSALGCETRLFGFVGQDAAEKFAQMLRAENINNFLLTACARTRVNTTVIDRRGGETHLREKGETVSPEKLADVAAGIRQYCRPGEMVAFCGSLPPGISAADFGNLIRELSGFRLAADISGAALAAAIENGACLIKPNREELCSLLGEATVNEQGVGQSARDLSRKYPSLTVLASDGAAGAYLATGTELFHGKCVGEIKVVNTVGAGDALLAGYLSGVAAGKSARESLAIALRAASSSLASVTAGTLSLDVMKNIAVAVASLGA